MSEEQFTVLLSQLEKLGNQARPDSRDALIAMHREIRRLRDAVLELVPDLPAPVLSQHARIVAMEGRLKKTAMTDSKYLYALKVIDLAAYKEVVQAHVQRLTVESHGSSIERYFAGRHAEQLINHTDSDPFVSDLLFPLAVRLFRDENTRVWRSGAQCLGSLFPFPRAREYIHAVMPTTLVAMSRKPSAETTWNIHAGRHALAALGRIGMVNREYAIMQIDAVFSPAGDETAKAFRRRRNVWYEASLVFSLPDLYRTDPKLTLEYFRRLAEYPVSEGENFAVHNNLITISGEMLELLRDGQSPLADQWISELRSWHQKISPYYENSDEPDVLKRFRQHTILNRDAYRVLHNHLRAAPDAKGSGLPNKNTGADLYSELDHLAGVLQEKESIIQRENTDILRRVDSFITLTNEIQRFFDTDTLFWSHLESSEITSGERKRIHIRWEQVATNAIILIGRVVKFGVERVQSPHAQERAEARLYLVHGTQLLITVHDTLPVREQRDAVRDVLFRLLQSDVGSGPFLFLAVKYAAVGLERILDGIWVSHSGQHRCLEVHQLTRQVLAQKSGGALAKKVLELGREDAAISCMMESCRLLDAHRSLIDPSRTCSLCGGTWKPLRSLLPVLARIHGVLTNTVEVEEEGRGFLGVLAELREGLVNPDQSVEAETQFMDADLWPRLVESRAPRHLVRDKWHEATALERAATYRFLVDSAGVLYTHVLGRSHTPFSAATPRAAANLAETMVQPIGTGPAKRRRTTLLGVLLSPPGPPTGRDQLRSIHCFRSLEDANRCGREGSTPWPGDPGGTICVSFETVGAAALPPVALPWYLFVGLVQALSQDTDDAWYGASAATIRRCYEKGDEEYRVEVFPTDIPWRMAPDSLLRSGDLPYDEGAHKVGFWLRWIEHILGNGEHCWSISRRTGTEGECLSVVFPITTHDAAVRDDTRRDELR